MTDESSEPLVYMDRDGDVWITWYKANGEVCLIERDGDSWLSLATVETHHGPLVPLVREDVVVAREEAAERRGAHEALVWAANKYEEIMLVSDEPPDAPTWLREHATTLADPHTESG